MSLAPVSAVPNLAIDEEADLRAIAELLESDLKDAEFAFTHSSGDRKPGDRRANTGLSPSVNADTILALRLAAEVARSHADHQTARQVARDELEALRDHHQADEMLKRESEAAEAARQIARIESQQDADFEMAWRLKLKDDRGEEDIDDFPDAVDVMGPQRMQQLMRSTERPLHTPYEQTRAATPSPSPAARLPLKRKAEEAPSLLDRLGPKLQPPNPPAECLICFDSFRIVANPVQEGESSGTALKLGVRTQPCRHAFCQACLARHITMKISDQQADKVFPIICPGCAAGGTQIDDALAGRVLPSLVDWHSRKLLDSLGMFFCPNKSCSEHLVRHEDQDQPMAQCPRCQTAACVNCRVVWHDGLTCEAYQALPDDQRLPEDRAFAALAKSQDWKQCPSCSVRVDKFSGCNHVTCRCKAEWCWTCGSTWGKDKCPRDCALFDEEELLDEDERRRVEQDERYNEQRQRLGFLFGGNLTNRFSELMISTRRCGYCHAGFVASADLQTHLLTCRHDVYVCCGRAFIDDRALDQHITHSTRQHFDRLVRP